jgi:hypothetical protein
VRELRLTANRLRGVRQPSDAEAVVGRFPAEVSGFRDDRPSIRVSDSGVDFVNVLFYIKHIAVHQKNSAGRLAFGAKVPRQH